MRRAATGCSADDADSVQSSRAEFSPEQDVGGLRRRRQVRPSAQALRMHQPGDGSRIEEAVGVSPGQHQHRSGVAMPAKVADLHHLIPELGVQSTAIPRPTIAQQRSRRPLVQTANSRSCCRRSECMRPSVSFGASSVRNRTASISGMPGQPTALRSGRSGRRSGPAGCRPAADEPSESRTPAAGDSRRPQLRRPDPIGRPHHRRQSPSTVPGVPAVGTN